MPTPLGGARRSPSSLGERPPCPLGSSSAGAVTYIVFGRAEGWESELRRSGGGVVALRACTAELAWWLAVELVSRL